MQQDLSQNAERGKARNIGAKMIQPGRARLIKNNKDFPRRPR
jgi:hypothetical protein